MTEPKTITIDTEENDDWMKTLPGYQNEVVIIESVAPKKKSVTIKMVPKEEEK